jgi:hypothetical protein
MGGRSRYAYLFNNIVDGCFVIVIGSSLFWGETNNAGQFSLFFINHTCKSEAIVCLLAHWQYSWRIHDEIDLESSIKLKLEHGTSLVVAWNKDSITPVTKISKYTLFNHWTRQTNVVTEKNSVLWSIVLGVKMCFTY